MAKFGNDSEEITKVLFVHSNDKTSFNSCNRRLNGQKANTSSSMRGGSNLVLKALKSSRCVCVYEPLEAFQ